MSKQDLTDEQAAKIVAKWMGWVLDKEPSGRQPFWWTDIGIGLQKITDRNAMHLVLAKLATTPWKKPLPCGGYALVEGLHWEFASALAQGQGVSDDQYMRIFMTASPQQILRAAASAIEAAKAGEGRET